MSLLHITSHLDDKKHDDLLSDFDESRFPTFLVLDQNGGLLARHRGWRTIAGFKITIAGGPPLQAADSATPPTSRTRAERRRGSMGVPRGGGWK